MTDYVCLGCNENCTWYKYTLIENGFLNNDGEIFNQTCPYCMMMTDFQECEGEEEDDDEQ